MSKRNTNTSYCKVSCSNTIEKFTLIFDGVENYFIFYDNKQVNQINDAINPIDLFNLVVSKIFKDIKENAENQTLKQFISEIDNKLKTHATKSRVLQDVLRSLAGAYNNDDDYLMQLNQAPQQIKEFIRDLSAKYGYDNTAFDSLLNPGDIEKTIKQRTNPVLTSEEKAKADAIAKQINNHGLLAYLDNILKDIHIGEHKNIYRKTLMLFKIMRGEASFLSETTAKAEAGKSFEDDIVFELIAPSRYIFKVNDITLPSFRRYGSINPFYFNRLVVLFGDLGSKKSFDNIEDIFNVFKVLITENEYNSTISDNTKGNGWQNIELNLKVESIGAVYSTVKNSFTEDDQQLISRTIFSTPANVDDKEIMKQQFYLFYKNSKQSKAKADAENKLKEFGLYLMQMVNLEIEIINPYIDIFMDYAIKSDSPIRELKQQLELFDAYCILTHNKCIKENGSLFASLEQLKEYMDFINLENALIPIEYDFLKMIIADGKANQLTIVRDIDYYKHLENIKNAENIAREEKDILISQIEKEMKSNKVISLIECENNAIELISEYAETKADLNNKELKEIPNKLIALYGLRGTGTNHKCKVFFRLSDLKGLYYKYRPYKNVENLSQMLHTLHNKGYLGRYEQKHGKENIYYITPLCETLNKKFEPKKTFEEYKTNFINNTQ